MRVLYLVPRVIFERKMSRVRFQQIDHLAELAFVHRSGPGWPDWNSGVSVVDNIKRLHDTHEFDIGLMYKVDDLLGSPIPFGTQYNEAYSVAGVTREVRDNTLRFVIFHHWNDLTRYPHWDSLSVHRYHVHHCADTRVYRDYEQEKDIDILVAGNLNSYYYPLRHRLMLLAKLHFRKRGYHVVILQHPGYQLPPREGTVVGEEFARLLNRSKLVFTCSMRFKYALAKYSEIALCKSLAVADVPDERQDFFSETIVNVESWWTDDMIIREVEGLLDDESGRLQKLTSHSYDRNLATSTMGQYAERLVMALRDVLKMGR